MDIIEQAFGTGLLEYMNLDNLSDNTKNYIQRLCKAIIALIGKSIKDKPNIVNVDSICNVLTTLFTPNMATRYISRIKDRQTKFNEYYNDKTKHTNLFTNQPILTIDIEYIFHDYYPESSLDIFQALIAIIHEILDTIKPRLEEKPYMSNNEIIIYLLEDIPNKKEIIKKLDSISFHIYINKTKFIPFGNQELFKTLNDNKYKTNKQ